MVISRGKIRICEESMLIIFLIIFTSCENQSKLNKPPARIPAYFISSPASMQDSITVGIRYKDTLDISTVFSDSINITFIDSVPGMVLSLNKISWVPITEDTGTKTIRVRLLNFSGESDTLSWEIIVLKPIDYLRNLIGWGKVPGTYGMTNPDGIQQRLPIVKRMGRVYVKFERVDSNKVRSIDTGLYIEDFYFSSFVATYDTNSTVLSKLKDTLSGVKYFSHEYSNGIADFFIVEDVIALLKITPSIDGETNDQKTPKNKSRCGASAISAMVMVMGVFFFQRRKHLDKTRDSRKT